MKRYTFLDLATVNQRYMPRIEEALLRVARSGRYVGGEEVEAFERELAAMMGVEHAIGVSNGLDALRLIFMAYIEMGVMRPGDEVIVPSNTYIASVLAVTDNGLTPVFAEPDMATMNLDAECVERCITDRTVVVMPVHLYGRVCMSDALADVVARHSLMVVEDNAQAIGASQEGVMTGALGNAAAFSFYPTKNVGALGDAGAVTTDDAELAAAVRALRNYGTDRQYHNVYAGLNCRLDPVQAAILRAKLPDMDFENAYRREIASIYDASICNPAVQKPAMPAEPGQHVWHQYVVMTCQRDSFRDYLMEHGVETAIHYPTAMHRQPCYENRFGHLHLPVAERIAREVVSLPVTRCTSPSDAREIADIINGWRPPY